MPRPRGALSVLRLSSFVLRRWPVVGLLAAAIAARVALLPAAGFPSDIANFQRWGDYAAGYGVTEVYTRTGADYPPLGLFLLSLLSRLRWLLWPAEADPVGYTVLVKLPGAVGDLLLAALILWWVGRRADRSAGVLAAAAYALNPAVLYGGAWWGQWDSLVSVCIVAGVLALGARGPRLAWALLSVGLLLKPQAAVLGPLVLLATWQRWGLRGALLGAETALYVATPVLLPFALDGRWRDVTGAYLGAASLWPYVHMNAFNLWYLATGPAGRGLEDTTPLVAGLTYRTVGLSLFAVCAAALLWQRWRAENAAGPERARDTGADLATAAALYAAFFMLPTQIHERYLFPVLPLLAMLAHGRLLLWPVYAALSFALFANLAYVFPWDATATALLGSIGLTPPVAAWLHLSGWLALTAWALGVGRWALGSPHRQRPTPNAQRPTPRWDVRDFAVAGAAALVIEQALVQAYPAVPKLLPSRGEELVAVWLTCLAALRLYGAARWLATVRAQQTASTAAAATASAGPAGPSLAKR